MSTGDPTQSAVVVAVPPAEAVVSAHRRRYDVSASWGVPAHVSVLYPFLPPARFDGPAFERLASAVASVSAFDCEFATTSWFGDEVVWLAPEPDRPFRELTAAVWRAFPDFPPYRGAFADAVPHLTVGEGRRGGPADLRAAEDAVRERLPISMRVEHADLIAGRSAARSWRTVERFPLGSG